ncbi:uncharacterized protein LOC132707180 [Cylas formicarius]|uniref:uncharacterized protein LOC132707180 n=1 Tax=Cylas formicarius TaxID=197179 RepID=UPI002958757D|nr:uncharacterized protein LOC132707180 [Cylas formicarius]XP_060534899.1 uncharacterized protein LOC132707180 [Cylas formicarius]XP_060534900.1 uncharacterized protein LOC132707180 [Cylas formicarius]XP_060534901.1 uncharacterized protein LOC132707180 [Cylas formicarius]XP_060534902.1 uncharacterized protein LOC132707180 [Cylas formicarius]XP_060534903.1 uncharacterized protein LOC132707180 [Cylas formicarius]XP_060534904.1 uncharacterized protein LOC132707180 [Cylas formicarius]
MKFASCILKTAICIALDIVFTLSVVSPSEDVTKLTQFGCRWFGGIVGMVSCNCTSDAEEMYIEPNSIPGFDTSIIEINRCPKVRFAPHSISDLRNLRRVSLNSIASVSFEESSMNWYGYRDVGGQEERFDLTVPSLKVILRNCVVEKIASQAFSGRINEISFEDVTVDAVDSFAFSNLLQTENVAFKYTTFKDVKPQAFKKFGTEYLTLDGVSAYFVPSRTFSNVSVHQRFSIINSNLESVRPGAFFIYNPSTFEVINTRISQLDGEAFKVMTRGDVVFRNNVFNDIHEGAFVGIRLNRAEVTGSHSITFDSNTFSTLRSGSLQVVGFDTRFANLNVNQSCDCELVEDLQLTQFFNDVRCLNDDVYVTVRDYASRSCSVVAGYTTVIVITCVVILAVALALIGLYVYYKTVYLSKKYETDKVRNNPGKISLIVPDGKTYKETEIHVILEKADLLTTEL